MARESTWTHEKDEKRPCDLSQQPLLSGSPPTPIALFAVFDGHGGKQAATHAAKHLVSTLTGRLEEEEEEEAEDAAPLSPLTSPRRSQSRQANGSEHAIPSATQRHVRTAVRSAASASRLACSLDHCACSFARSDASTLGS